MSTFTEMKLPEQTFVPLGKLVIIKPFFIEKTKKGVYLPDGDKFKGDATEVLESIRALVVAVGTTCKYVERGDIILLYPHKHPVAIKHGGNELLYATDELSVVGIESRLVNQDHPGQHLTEKDMKQLHEDAAYEVEKGYVVRVPAMGLDISHPDDQVQPALERVIARVKHDQ